MMFIDYSLSYAVQLEPLFDHFIEKWRRHVEPMAMVVDEEKEVGTLTRGICGTRQNYPC
jgi:hypothetical protein